eukprot:COSAG05_NODE_6447_length_956_cov_1.381564_1_plen_186_part_10
MYFATTLVALWYNPSFLLVNAAASVRDRETRTRQNRSSLEGGYGFLALYVLAPEKFVGEAAFNKGGLCRMDLLRCTFLVGLLLDLCGVGALVAMLMAMLAGGKLIAALAVGYVFATLSFLCESGFLIRAAMVCCGLLKTTHDPNLMCQLGFQNPRSQSASPHLDGIYFEDQSEYFRYLFTGPRAGV